MLDIGNFKKIYNNRKAKVFTHLNKGMMDLDGNITIMGLLCEMHGYTVSAFDATEKKSVLIRYIFNANNNSNCSKSIISDMKSYYNDNKDLFVNKSEAEIALLSYRAAIRKSIKGVYGDDIMLTFGDSKDFYGVYWLPISLTSKLDCNACLDFLTKTCPKIYIDGVEIEKTEKNVSFEFLCLTNKLEVDTLVTLLTNHWYLFTFGQGKKISKHDEIIINNLKIVW